MKPFGDPAVKAVFDAYPAPLRAPLLKLRALILAAAAESDGVGEVVETLKWGEPAYLPAKARVGTTVRINALKGTRDKYAMFVNCQTTLIDTFRQRYGDQLAFEGTRAVVFKVGEKLPEKAVKHCVALALTYHRSR